MIRKFILPLLALAGVIFAIHTVIASRRPVVPAAPVAEPARSTFDSYVSGAGIVEANTENIAISTPVGEVVTEVCVKVGDRVRKGQPLFKLNDSVFQAELLVRQAALDAAKAKLDRLMKLPRPEDLPPTESRVNEAMALLEDAKSRLAMVEGLADKRAVSQDDVDRRRFAVRAAEARLTTAKAELDLLRAGTWQPDIAVARADVASAAAVVEQTRAELARRIVLSPIDGDILQVKIRVGEYAQPGPLSTSLMLLGNVQPLCVRVDVDENDAWRIRPNTPAEAYIRGNADLHTPLKFVRVESYVVPKRALTGDSSERVDTRVLQIIYSFDRGDFPVYVGQQMDVFIKAPPIGQASGNIAAARAATTREGGIR